MCYEKNGLSFEHNFKTLCKHMPTNMDIQSWQRVIKQVDITVTVHSSGQTDPLFLTPTQS